MEIQKSIPATTKNNAGGIQEVGLIIKGIEISRVETRIKKIKK